MKELTDVLWGPGLNLGVRGNENVFEVNNYKNINYGLRMFTDYKTKQKRFITFFPLPF